MTWKVEIERGAARELRSLDRPVQDRILGFLRARIATPEDPRRLGKALAGPLSSVWRYRIGDYRLFCAIEDGEGVVCWLRLTEGPQRLRTTRADTYKAADPATGGRPLVRA